MALRANIDFLGQVPFAERIGDRDESGYRPVPSSDKGNAGYRDRGGLGSYTPSREPYRNPDDVKMFAGYGASEEDLQRGYCEPAIREDPAYDLDNYKDRSSQPMASDIDEGGDAMADDYAFRRLNERSRGFLTRPRIPTDR